MYTMYSREPCELAGVSAVDCGAGHPHLLQRQLGTPSPGKSVEKSDAETVVASCTYSDCMFPPCTVCIWVVYVWIDVNSLGRIADWVRSLPFFTNHIRSHQITINHLTPEISRARSRSPGDGRGDCGDFSDVMSFEKKLENWNWTSQEISSWFQAV